MDGKDDRDDQDDASAKTKHPLRLASFVLLGIVATGAFATLFTTLASRSAINVDATLKLAVEEFKQGKWQVAGSLCDTLTESPEWTDPNRKMHAYIAAASATQLALELTDAVQRRVQTAEAIQNLSAVKEAGFPELYNRDGLLLLGQARYIAGDFTGAAEAFSEGIQNQLDDQRRYYRQLADSQFRSIDIASTIAIATIDKFLALPTIGGQERADANLLRAKILTDQNRWDEATQAIKLAATEPAFESDARLVATKVKLARAKTIIRDARRQNSDAPIPQTATHLIAESLDELIEIGRTANDETKALATLAAGQAQRILGNREKALGLFGIARQNQYYPAVSIAGSIEELEMLATDSPIDDCMGAVTFLAGSIDDPQTFDPQLLSLDEFRVRLTGVVESIQRREEFKASIDIARKLVPIFEPADALRMEAASFTLWAAATKQKGIQADGSIAPADLQQSKKLHESAGNAFAAAAQERFTSEGYPGFLWDAIEQYDLAHRYSKCMDLLEPYLRYEVRDQLPRGLIMQAGAMMALDEFTSAIRVCDTCIAEFPRDSLAYEARLLAARSARELGDAATAQTYLEANLHDGLLAPDSRPWRDSLFALGELLYNEAISTHLSLITPKPSQALADPDEQAAMFRKNQLVFDEAIRRLEEAQTRYVDLRESRRSVYLSAQAHQYAAHWPHAEANLPDTIDSARRELLSLHRQHLLAAAKTYQALRNDMNTARDDGALTDQEQSMLRNCYLGEADALFALGEMESAIDAYRATANRFINEPIALEALVQQARCFELLKQSADVERILKQAQQILERIPTEFDDRFASTTRYDRAGWSEFLNWMLRS